MKYKTTYDENVGLLRVESLRDIHNEFKTIPAGTVGGYIQNESSLSQEDNCWLDKDSKILGNAMIRGDVYLLSAYVADNAYIEGKSNIKGLVNENAMIVGNCVTSPIVLISGNSKIYGNVHIQDYSMILGNAVIMGKDVDIQIGKNSYICGNAYITRHFFSGYIDKKQFVIEFRDLEHLFEFDDEDLNGPRLNDAFIAQNYYGKDVYEISENMFYVLGDAMKISEIKEEISKRKYYDFKKDYYTLVYERYLKHKRENG